MLEMRASQRQIHGHLRFAGLGFNLISISRHVRMDGWCQVKGFSECMRALRPGLDAVHDVTIAYHNYKDGGPPSDKTMLAGINSFRSYSNFLDETAMAIIAKNKRYYCTPIGLYAQSVAAHLCYVLDHRVK